MGKSGKSDKKVKSERLNALRKQYDSFLEEDRKRKERNEYILGRLDKMRTCDKLVVRYREPVSIKVDHPVWLSNRSSRNDSELQPFRRNYSVEPPPRTVDELDLLRVISKNYILIPKREQRSDDPREFTLEKNTPDHDNDWKSKYDILKQLKKKEKEPNDQVEQSTEMNERASNSKYDAEYLTVAKQNNKLSMNSMSPATSIDPEIPERDFGSSNVEENCQEYPVYKDLIKPIKQMAINVINDTSDTFTNHGYDTSTIKNLNNAYRPVKDEPLKEPFSEQIQQSEQEILTRHSQNMRRPQAYIESDAVEDKAPKENYLEESGTHLHETKTSDNFVAGLDQPLPGPDIKQSKDIINQEYPLFEEDQEYPTEVADIDDFTLSEVASVQQDALDHSPDHINMSVNENSLPQEYNQEQAKHSPESTAMVDPDHFSKGRAEVVSQDQENKELDYSQAINENYQEVNEHGFGENYNVEQIDDTQNYDQSKQEVTYDQNSHEINYEQNDQDVNNDPNVQNVNYDQHAALVSGVLAQDDVLNCEQAPEDATYDQNAQNANYDQISQEQTYEGDAQQNYAADQTYAHTENYPDQNQPVGEHYDQNYPVDGVYQPDASYATDQAFTDGVDQNYANVQNEPVAYDHDITQQQYDQTYAEQYSVDEQPQAGYEQPNQYQQDYDQVYDQYQQNEQDAVEGVQQQLDTEDGYVEQSPATNANEAVPEATVPVTT